MAYGKNIIVCDPDPAYRMRFKQVALGSCQFSEITMARDLASVHSILERSKARNYHAIISSFRSPAESLLTFTKNL